MARGGGGGCCGRWVSYRRTTVVVCCANLVAALYVLRSLYISYYIFSSASNAGAASTSVGNAPKYTDEQIEMMKESIEIRQASEPGELVRMVKKLKKELTRKRRNWVLSRSMKQRLASEILQRFRELDEKGSTAKHQVLENWRMEKLQEARIMATGGSTSNSSIPLQEAKALQRALESDWPVLLEDVGLWMPIEVINKKANETEEFEEEEDIIAGPPLPAECHAETHTDYAGAAVRWGLTHQKETASECCQACLDQAKQAKPGEMKCNIWVYCPSENGCFSPDKYVHKHQECWLKQDEKPRLNFKDKYSQAYRDSHPAAPLIVPWMSGIIG